MHSLSSIQMLECLDEEDLIPLECACSWRHYSSDEVIISAGRNDRNDVFFVTEGSVRLAYHTGVANEVIFTEREAGSFFGEMGPFDSGALAYTVVAQEDCIIAIMPNSIFSKTVSEYRLISQFLLRFMANSVRDLMLPQQGLPEVSEDQRIYGELLRGSVPSPHGDGVWLIEKLPSHQDIANLCQASERTVSEAIAQLIRSGLVRRKNSSLYILDRGRLRQLANAA